MRGAKEEKKLVTPMFSRLHVKDREKGGPRAPPRNKMAFHEQFSVPSQRFSKSASMLPLWSDNSSNLVPSTSPSHVGGCRSSMFTPLCNSPAHSYLFSGVNSNTMVGSHEQNSMKSTSYQSLNAAGTLSSTVKSNSFQSHNVSIGDENDCRFGTPAQGIDPHCSNSQCSREREKLPHLSLSSSVKLQNASEKRISRTGTIDMSSREFVRKQAEEHSIMSTTDKNTLSKKTRDKKSESCKRAQRYLNQENRSSLVDNFNRLQGTNARLHQENVAEQDKIVLGDDILVEPAKDMGKENTSSNLRRESCSRPSLGDDNRSSFGLVNGSDDKRCGSVQDGDVDRHDDDLDTSMVHSISVLDISSNDVIGVIGEKKFWNVKRAIVNQQKVLAGQVFELHRLIEVQRLIAGSPRLLLEDNLYLGKPSLEVSPVKKFPSEYSPELPSPPIVKAKDNSQKANPSTECTGENAVGKFPLLSVNNDTGKELVTQQSNYAHYSGNPPPAPAANSTKPPPWYVHSQPGSQWLFPVMSPSEGLVYKPYTGPCPPTEGFMATMYGNCGPTSLYLGNGDFLNTAHGVPVSHHQIRIIPGTPPLRRTKFLPYGLPIMNQSLSGSAVEQMSLFPGAQSNGQDNQLSTGDNNFAIPQQSSCKMSSQVSQAISCCVGGYPVLKESELQGSRASSPSERAKGDAVAPFPMTPTVQGSDQNVQTTEHRAQVIKVVPHNPKSATESVARILLLLQEENKQL